MSFLSDIFSYWQTNSTLNATIPFSSVYTGLAPEQTPFPYVVITVVSSEPTFLTGINYFEDFTFQLSVYSNDLDQVEVIAKTIINQFDWQIIPADGSHIATERQNYQVFVDPDTPQLTYHAMIQYGLTKNRTIGS